MQKYWEVFRVTIAEYFTYRLNFVLWRLRSFLNMMVVYFLWNSVLANQRSFGSYGRESLLSYIIFVNLIISFVMGTRTTEIAEQINSGGIINLLLKPVNFFRYYIMRDLADKAVNIGFSIMEVALFVILFRVPLVPPANIWLFIILFACGTLISFYINLILSFIGFWTTEVWAPRFVFFMVVSFLSGAYFPLDLMPPLLYRLFLLTPFPYLYYLPTKILLGRKDSLIFWEIGMSFVWVFLVYRIALYMWNKGIKSFSFWGR